VIRYNTTYPGNRGRPIHKTGDLGQKKKDINLAARFFKLGFPVRLVAVGESQFIPNYILITRLFFTARPNEEKLIFSVYFSLDEIIKKNKLIINFLRI